MRTPDEIELSIVAIESPGESRSQHTTRTKSDFEGHDAAILNRMGRPVGMNVRVLISEVESLLTYGGTKRNFGSLSILALSITLLASWESIAGCVAVGKIESRV